MKKVKVSLSVIFVVSILLCSTTATALSANNLPTVSNRAQSQGTKAGTGAQLDRRTEVGIQLDQRTGVTAQVDHRTKAGAQADKQARTGMQNEPEQKPNNEQQIIITKIIKDDKTEIKNVCLSELVLDQEGCTYEPADRNAAFAINKNVEITANNVILINAVITGDLYIYADNIVLQDIVVKGTVHIRPLLNKSLKLDNVTFDNVAIIMDTRLDADNGTDDEQEHAGGLSDGNGHVDGGQESDNSPDFDVGESSDNKNDVHDNMPEDENVSEAEEVTGKGKGKNNDEGEKSGLNDGKTGNMNEDKTNQNIDSGVGSNGENKDDENINDKASESTEVKAYLEQAAIDDYSSNLVIVNKARSLPTNYKPKDLVRVNVPYSGRSEARYLRKEASEALTRLFISARSEGVDLWAVSGFRSYDLQKVVFAKHADMMGVKTAERVSAKPGQSEHQTGLAIDISSRAMNYTLNESFENTNEGKWLAENAAKFGFILRYPKGKETITGYDYEPWHFRFVGKDIAIDIMKKGLTLEEYFGLAQAQQT